MNNSSRSLLLTVGIALLFLFFSLPSSARSLQEIRHEGLLRLCVAGSNADFYRKNGELLARFLGVKSETIYLESWDTQFHGPEGVTRHESSYVPLILDNGTCDVLPNDLHILDWRTSKLAIVPYYSTRMVVVGQRDEYPFVRTIADLQGKKAVVQKGTAYETWVREQNENRLLKRSIEISYASTEEGMTILENGLADFTVVGSESSFRWVRGRLNNLLVLFPVGRQVDVGWGVHPKDDDLKSEIERFFSENRSPDSDLDRSWKSYYNISLMEYHLFFDAFASQGISLKAILRWAIPISGLLGIVLATILFWNLRLKQEVTRRKSAEEKIAVLLEQQTRFFSLVSHELRNSLGVIVSGVANLKTGLADGNETTTQRIKRISDAATHLSSLIDRHLRLQRLTSADFELEMEECSPALPALYAIELISGVCADRIVQYEPSENLPDEIRIDVQLIALAISNLLDNAIKYSPAGTPITLSILRDRDRSDFLLYCVHDSGTSLAEVQTEALFGMYSRSRRNEKSGFGIGLALVSNIVKHHGGSVSCKSTTHTGTTFSISLPLENKTCEDL